MSANNLKSSQAKIDYSIGIVTYVARFEEFFMPLIRQMASVFPDKEIVCIINGHPDKSLQVNYLKHATAFLADFPNVRYLTYENHQALAKCFNWLIMMSFAPRMLILNDDVSLNLLFREELEAAISRHPEFFIINHSWSHFVISKNVVKKVGWFEERLPATGQEDADYQIRMASLGMEITDQKLHGAINYVAPQTNAGWQSISSVSKITGKAASANDEFFEKKFAPNGKSKDSYNAYSVNPGMETPIFYDLSCLENESKYPAPKMAFKGGKPGPFLKVLLPLQWSYSFTRKIGGRVYRFIKVRLA